MFSDKVITIALAVVLAASTGFFSYKWGIKVGENKAALIKANAKAEVDSLKMSHQIENLKIRLEYATKSDFIKTATPGEVDSLFTSYGF